MIQLLRYRVEKAKQSTLGMSVGQFREHLQERWNQTMDALKRAEQEKHKLLQEVPAPTLSPSHEPRPAWLPPGPLLPLLLANCLAPSCLAPCLAPSFAPSLPPSLPFHIASSDSLPPILS